MTEQDWLAIVQAALPGVPVAEGPVQEAPRGAGRFVRVWQSGYQSTIDEGQVEVEWTMTVHVSTRGLQDLGPVYRKTWDDFVTIAESVDRTMYSIGFLQAEVAPAPEEGYLVLVARFTEMVELPLAW